MANEIANECQYDCNDKRARVTQHALARLVMIVSWGAGTSLAWTTVVSPDIRWRCVAMFMSVLVLAPTLVLAFRQVARQNASADEQAQTETPVRASEGDDEQTGVYVDEPTGLASRRYLTMFLQREISRSGRAGACLSLAVFDVDEFHKLEEQTGAQAVTTALADVGARLKSALREYDLVAKYAAGRLAVVLPETDARGVSEIVGRLHELATSVCVNGEQLSVTVGLAMFPEHGASAEELINSAHRALNRGKFEAANAVHTLDELKMAS
jgi:diguanylate cyclase (GGDEF)-like protein